VLSAVRLQVRALLRQTSRQPLSGPDAGATREPGMK
jgi:hypothetical protein